MKCQRSQKMPIDWSSDNLRVDGKEACKGQIKKFVRGINGKRKAPVTKKQIENWCSATPSKFVGECLSDLIAEGAIDIFAKSLGSHRRANGGYVYQIANH